MMKAKNFPGRKMARRLAAEERKDCCHSSVAQHFRDDMFLTGDQCNRLDAAREVRTKKRRAAR